MDKIDSRGFHFKIVVRLIPSGSRYYYYVRCENEVTKTCSNEPLTSKTTYHQPT